jgi:ABC-type lipoprotein export system ATPase subunit
VLDDGRYDHIVHQANRFLVGKQLDKFDERTMELMVRTDHGARHPVHMLSAGEKQVLLMLVYISRWLEPGGIVLVDEPDLHLHVSLAKSFTSYLRQMVIQKNGQLIIASHEPALWEQFTQSQRIELGSVTEVLR